jgi:hypothetical protein
MSMHDSNKAPGPKELSVYDTVNISTARMNLKSAIIVLGNVQSSLGHSPDGRRVSLAITKAEEALMWLRVVGEVDEDLQR